MPASKTKKAQVIKRRERVAKMYLRGKPMYKIAEIEGVGNATITRDLKALREQWAENAQQDIGEKINEQLEKYAGIISEAWEQYERSLDEKEMSITRSDLLPDRGNPKKPVLNRQAVTKRVEKGTGDVKYLKIILDAMAQQEKILGIHAPKKLEHSGAVELTKGYVSISPDDWDTEHNKEQSASDYGPPPTNETN